MNNTTDREVGAPRCVSTTETHNGLDPALISESERDPSDPPRYAKIAPMLEALGNATVPIIVGTKRPAPKPNGVRTAKQATQERWKDEYPKFYTGIRTGQPFPLDDIDAPVGNALDVDVGIPEGVGRDRSRLAQSIR